MLRLGTKDLGDAQVPLTGFEQRITGSFLVVGATQILGGGQLRELPTDHGLATITACWGVSDLSVAHWVQSLEDVSLITVPDPVAACVRATLDRFALFTDSITNRETARREGVLDVVRMLYREGDTLRRGASLASRR